MFIIQPFIKAQGKTVTKYVRYNPFFNETNRTLSETYDFLDSSRAQGDVKGLICRN